MKELTCDGFTSPAITWFKSYSYNRVFFNGSFSKIRYVPCGVPQGSYLGPSLFSIFINDLYKARMTMYAADSTPYMSASKASELTEIQNKDLQSLSEWLMPSRNYN